MTTKKTNTNTKVEEVNLDKLADLSGEKDTKLAPTFKLPSLRVNGKTGGYFRTVLKPDGSLETGEDGKALLLEVKNPTGIILRPRKSFSFIGRDFQLFTNEGGNTQKANFVVFKKSEGKKGDVIQAVGQGTPAEIKTQFPELKMTQILFFLLDTEAGQELCRLKIKGMGLGNLFDYWKEFDSNEHFFQFKTILGEKSDKNQFGKFVKTTFKKGEKVKDLTEVKKNLEMIGEKINAIDEYAKERNDEQEAMIKVETNGTRPPASRSLDEIRESMKELNGEEAAEAVGEKVKEVKEEQDEINVKDIPFG